MKTIYGVICRLPHGIQGYAIDVDRDPAIIRACFDENNIHFIKRALGFTDIAGLDFTSYNNSIMFYTAMSSFQTNHSIFKELYPDGYTLEWLGEYDSNSITKEIVDNYRQEQKLLHANQEKRAKELRKISKKSKREIVS